jgi:hypothetical protein
MFRIVSYSVILLLFTNIYNRQDQHGVQWTKHPYGLVTRTSGKEPQDDLNTRLTLSVNSSQSTWSRLILCFALPISSITLYQCLFFPVDFPALPIPFAIIQTSVSYFFSTEYYHLISVSFYLVYVYLYLTQQLVSLLALLENYHSKFRQIVYFQNHVLIICVCYFFLNCDPFFISTLIMVIVFPQTVNILESFGIYHKRISTAPCRTINIFRS